MAAHCLQDSLCLPDKHSAVPKKVTLFQVLFSTLPVRFLMKGNHLVEAVILYCINLLSCLYIAITGLGRRGPYSQGDERWL